MTTKLLIRESVFNVKIEQFVENIETLQTEKLKFEIFSQIALRNILGMLV